MGGVDWIDVAQDMDTWRAILNSGCLKFGEFVDSLRIY